MTDWLWRIAVGKAAKRAVQYAVAWAAGKGLEAHGVNINPDVLTGSLLAAAELGRNWLKVKTGWKWL